MVYSRSFWCFLYVLTLMFQLCGSPAQAADIPPIAAAADLQFALSKIATEFQRETGRSLKLTFGSSGNFTRQIEQGAPFEMFLSADENYVFRLAEHGLTWNRGVLYAIGRVGLFVPNGSTLSADPELKDLRAALTDGRIRRFAIANPDHAPYGRAAQAVLKTAGLWDIIKPKLVLGENASQAMQFAASGASQGGIVPRSLSLAPEIAALGHFALIPATWHVHEPLRQRMVLMRSAGATAEAFYFYLQRPEPREILRRYGFVLPEGNDQ
ncbi:MAG: molybdate ABC transporter substrate-binding protein [Desulfuromusa sp.]|nr:molybdate ABC transporter substrate-binding protein [Desulfuromusa sp.]